MKLKLFSILLDNEVLNTQFRSLDDADSGFADLVELYYSITTEYCDIQSCKSDICGR